MRSYSEIQSVLSQQDDEIVSSPSPHRSPLSRKRKADSDLRKQVLDKSLLDDDIMNSPEPLSPRRGQNGERSPLNGSPSPRKSAFFQEGSPKRGRENEDDDKGKQSFSDSPSSPKAPVSKRGKTPFPARNSEDEEDSSSAVSQTVIVNSKSAVSPQAVAAEPQAQLAAVPRSASLQIDRMISPPSSPPRMVAVEPQQQIRLAPILPPLALGLNNIHPPLPADTVSTWASSRMRLASGDQTPFAHIHAAVQQKARLYLRSDVLPGQPLDHYCQIVSSDNDHPKAGSKEIDFMVQEGPVSVVGKMLNWQSQGTNNLCAHLANSNLIANNVKNIKAQLEHLFQIQRIVRDKQLGNVFAELVVVFPAEYSIEHGRCLLAYAIDELTATHKIPLQNLPYFRLMGSAERWVAISYPVTGTTLQSYVADTKKAMTQMGQQLFFQVGDKTLPGQIDHMKRHLQELGNPTNGWSRFRHEDIHNEQQVENNIRLYEFFMLRLDALRQRVLVLKEKNSIDRNLETLYQDVTRKINEMSELLEKSRENQRGRSPNL